MATQRILSIDIGSTYTKGAVFLYDSATDGLSLDGMASVSTTCDNIGTGFGRLQEKLPRADVCCYSSSARGGLKIAAIGLVPELTLKTAQLCAMSAGGRVTGVYAYKLTAADITEIQNLRPDIVLVCGGTDGGDESYVRHNIQRLSDLDDSYAFIYAGNRALRDFVGKTLSGKEVSVTENVLPELDRPNIEPARRTIRDVFLEKIVHGKGLSQVIERAGSKPLPTPYAVYEFIKAFGCYAPEWNSFCVVDMGGATTDVYSCCEGAPSEANIIYKGVPEPTVKRTVEGDLGLRVSAAAAWQAGSAYWSRCFDDGGAALEAYASKLHGRTSLLPETDCERNYEAALAAGCFHLAIKRHAGTLHRIFTPMGEKFVQEGKDLRGVRQIIGTGGYLARHPFPSRPDGGVFQGHQEAIGLSPAQAEYWRDEQHLFTLLANVYRLYPRQAVETALTVIKKSNDHPIIHVGGVPV
ncbi:MAG: glutamate mutase L [Planctomycetales bacterium]|nr:glutamate mutase L [Planctomycetales bacterium]